MLTADDYNTLIKLPYLVDVYDYLKANTYYQHFLQCIDGTDLHRSEFEVALYKLQIREIEKIMHYLQGEEKNFIKTFLVRSDIESLRLLIREISRGEPLENLAPLMIYSSKYTEIDFERLLKSKNWDEFKKNLSDTEFYRVLEIYPEVSLDEDLFPVEKSLERYYYDKLVKCAGKLDKKENKELAKTIRSGIDLLNLVWFYRGRKFYHLSRQELLAYSYRGGLRITPSVIENISGITDMEKLREVMVSFSDYAFLFNHTKTLDLYMERRRERYLYYHYLKLLNGFEAGVGKVVGFIRLCEFEIKDITSIIEAKRYQMTPEKTYKYLIRSFED